MIHPLTSVIGPRKENIVAKFGHPVEFLVSRMPGLCTISSCVSFPTAAYIVVYLSFVYRCNLC